MQNKDYDAQALSLQIKVHATSIERLLERTRRLSTDLAKRDSEYDSHAHDHAAETLATIGRELGNLSSSMTRLQAYTNYPPIEFQTR